MTPNEYAAKHKLDGKNVRRHLRALFAKKHGGNGQHKLGSSWRDLSASMIKALDASFAGSKPRKPAKAAKAAKRAAKRAAKPAAKRAAKPAANANSAG